MDWEGIGQLPCKGSVEIKVAGGLVKLKAERTYIIENL